MAAPSARGLFRATGKSAKQDIPREENDFYPTPSAPTVALLKAEHERLQDYARIWEPAAGDGAMARDIAAAGYDVDKSDLIDRGCGAELRDFFDYTEPRSRCVITNPPYSAINWRDGKGKWVPHAMQTLGIDYMALLLNWSWPGAGGLSDVWAAWPPARVYLMRWKIDFTGQGAPPNLNAWFIWDREHVGETVLRMLDRPRA